MKRRKLCILTLILLLHTIFCITGKSQDIDYFAIFEHLNPDSIPTGILLDKSYPTSHILEFDGSDSTEITDTMIMTKKEWNKIYSELLMAYVDSVTIPTLGDIQDTLNEFDKQQMVPIYIVNMEYNRIKDNAFDDSLLVFTTDQLYDVPNPPESPYLTSRYFSALALPLNLDRDDFIFKLDSSIYISNTDDTIQSIDIDFGNNLLFTDLNLNSEIFIYRSELGSNAKLTVHLQEDSILVCKFEIKAVNDTTTNLKSTTIPLSATGSYNDKKIIDGTEFGVWFGCETTSIDNIKKPIIILEGWDPTNYRTLDIIYSETNVTWDGNTEGGFLPSLHNRGYDVILMNYKDGGGAIQDNAMVLRKFLDELNKILAANNSQNEIVIIGESMGGLVARYALAYMESIGEDHRTKLFMTMDTPNQGAYISYSVQHLGKIAFDIIPLLDIFGNGLSEFIGEEITSNDIETANKMLNAISSKQMLVYYRPDCSPEYPAPSPLRTQLLNEFNSFGNNGYPSNVDKMVAFSFGSGNGLNGTQGFGPGAERYSYNGPQEIFGIYFDNVRITTNAIPDQVSLKIIDISLEKKIPAPCIKWPILKLLCGRSISLKLPLVNLTVNGTLPYENAPGGYFNIATKNLVDILDGLLGTNVSSTLKNDCFVPTVSSLHLIGKPLDFDVRGNFTESPPESNYYEVNNPTITPFDAFYVEEYNKLHGAEGTTSGMIKKAFDLIVGDDNLVLKDKIFVNPKKQFEAKNSITLDNVNISSSIPLRGKSFFYLRAGQTVTFEKNISIGKNCTIEVDVRPYCQ
jgi:hypothetical protein